LCQLLGQAVLGAAAQAVYVTISTPLSVEEHLAEHGRFGDEGQRLSQISPTTRHSLVLLNESLASTILGKPLIAQDIVRILRRLGAPISLPCMTGRDVPLNASPRGESHSAWSVPD